MVVEAMAEGGWPGFPSHGPSSLVVEKLLLPGVFDLSHAYVSALLNRG
jgi:hypothetical protein